LSLRFPFQLLHKAGLRRDQFARSPLRDIARFLSSRGLIPTEILVGSPVETTFKVRTGPLEVSYYLTPGDDFGSALFWRPAGVLESDVLPVFIEFATSSTWFVDVGAHTGIYSLLAGAASPACEVVAFEPHPLTHARLNANIRANGFEGRCTALQAAAGRSSGVARPHTPDDLTMCSLSDSGDALEISVVALDELIPKDGRTSLVKIDVEGHEDEVLEGMSAVMRDSHPAIFFECNPGGPANAIEQLLRAHGYSVFSLRTGKLTRLSRLVPEEFSRGHHNFLARWEREGPSE
jgi:FkbM family methyltransferase